MGQMQVCETLSKEILPGKVTDEPRKLQVSVAMATYNGEKFIEEQLLSICRQSWKPDEIVISDDGSKDATLDVVARVAQSEEAKGIDFVVITDNPRHGCGGNFEWALSHTTGDVVFVCGQDDIWMPDKIQQIVRVFESHNDALCVLHNAEIIDSFGSVTDHPFLTEANAKVILQKCENGEVIKVRADLLEQCISRNLVPGIAIALRKDIVHQLTPIPTHAEDSWIEFVALLNNGCYFNNHVLAFYRKHDTNTSGSRSRGLKKIKKLFQGIKSVKNRKQLYLYTYELGKGCLERLEERKMHDTSAYGTAKRVYEIGLRKYNAYQKGGISGAWMVLQMYRTDMRYRRCGFWAFFYDLLFVLTKSK